jgi:hypothetical protein
MPGRVLLVVMSVALLLAAGILVVGIGRILLGIARHFFRERNPVRTLRHPRLGVLESDGYDPTLWRGQLRGNGSPIQFCIGGSREGPDGRLAGSLAEVAARLDAVEREAGDFLREREPEIGGATLDPHQLDFSDDRRPDEFAFEFVAGSDDARIWRVEFVGGKPVAHGWDD